MNWVDNALNTHVSALNVSAKRAEVLAANLANADTPNYKARDLDFRQVLSGIGGSALKGQSVTRKGHIDFSAGEKLNVYERTDTAVLANGNTVAKEVEQSAFTENSIRYLASLRFLNGSIQGILKAFRGE
ncbi:MAG: flagellar basal-body rod protein FlgB [Candidatus Azotimanducaceae bacterium]|jgi:flagellar basal-body rod protein FlgB